MKTRSFIPALLLLVGSILAGIAVFANLLGLDQHAGWGRTRIGVLLLGVLVILSAVAYYRYVNKVHSILYKIRAFGGNIPLPVLIVPLVSGVILVYAWFATDKWDAPTYYFDFLARSFSNSTLDMPLAPDPQLLALSNPYDPLARSGIPMMMDLSLYQGKYYLYWGPVPGLILSGIYLFFQCKISDLFLTFGFVSALFLVQTLLLLKLWNHYFRNVPRWLLYISILLSGLAGPLMLLRHNYEIARVYEVAIAGSQFFFMSGMLVAMISVIQPSVSSWRLAAAATLWALAIGTRQTLVTAIGFMVAVLVFWLYKTNSRLFKKAGSFLALGLPLVCGLALLGWYNWARFGSVTETGFYYALAGVNLQAHYHELFSPAYIFQNLYNYLFNAVEFTQKFPYVLMSPGKEYPVFSFYTVPDIYATEPIAGLLYTFPFAVLAGLTLFTFSSKNVFASPFPQEDNRKDMLLIVLSLGGSFLITFIFLTMFFWVGMRYEYDFMPTLTILSIIGFWQGYQFLELRALPRRLYTVIGASLAIACIVLNTLLAVSTNAGLVRVMLGHFPFP